MDAPFKSLRRLGSGETHPRPSLASPGRATLSSSWEAPETLFLLLLKL